MAKRGRPGIDYDEFKQTWQTLLEQGRATTNNALDILGGSKGTISKLREQFEQEEATKKLIEIEHITLPEKICDGLADIVMTRTKQLDVMYREQKARADEHLSTIMALESQLASKQVDFDDAKTQYEIDRTQYERRLAASEARIEDLKKREQTLLEKVDALQINYNQAKQHAAVAQKEVELLREQTPKSKPSSKYKFDTDI